MKIGAAYIRVSTDDQLEYSPDSQLKLIQQYAKKNDIIIPEEFIFIDAGISGKTAEKRPAFNDMIAIAKQKENSFDTILVWKFSRFARNQEQSIVYKKMLKNAGVDVVSISEPIIDGHFGSLIERILEWMDEFYLVNLSSEVRRSMELKATKGEALSIAPYGYYMKDKGYYINEEEAEVIREIFNRFISGEKIARITQYLRSIGVKTHRGNLPDHRFTEYVLHNPIYMGYTRWSKNGKKASKRDYYSEDFIITKGVHEAIVSQETFEKAQEILKENVRQHRKYQRSEQQVDYMLKGLLKCGNCGATLVYLSRKWNSVQCHNYTSGRGCTVSHSITLNKLEPMVIDALKLACETLNFKFDIPTTPTTKKANNIDSLLKKEYQKLDKIKEAYQCGIDTLEEYKENKAKIMETIDVLKKEMEKEQPQEDFSSQQYAQKVADVIKTIESPDITPELKNVALRTIISKIVYNKANSTIDIFFYP
jgi:DNA invertase Pin-like site-specific DNA recombinase